jgi:hypothetical protein
MSSAEAGRKFSTSEAFTKRDTPCPALRHASGNTRTHLRWTPWRVVGAVDGAGSTSPTGPAATATTGAGPDRATTSASAEDTDGSLPPEAAGGALTCHSSFGTRDACGRPGRELRRGAALRHSDAPSVCRQHAPSPVRDADRSGPRRRPWRPLVDGGARSYPASDTSRLLTRVDLPRRAEEAPSDDSCLLAHEPRHRRVHSGAGRTGLHDRREVPRQREGGPEPCSLPWAHRRSCSTAGHVPDPRSDASFPRARQDRDPPRDLRPPHSEPG